MVAIKPVLDHVEIAYRDGSNCEARACMLRASYLGGTAMAMSYVGYAHAVAHTLGGTYNIPHGLSISVVLPIVLEAYGPSVHEKLWKLAVYRGVADRNDSHEAGAQKFKDRLINL